MASESSSSSSSLGVFTDVWPYPRFNAERTGKTNLNIPGYDIKTVFTISYSGDNYSVTCPILINYSETLGDEILYVGTKRVSGGNGSRVFAIRSSGTVLWAGPLSTYAYGVRSITFSHLYKRLFYVLKDNSAAYDRNGDPYVYCLNIEDGSTKWSYIPSWNPGVYNKHADTEVIPDDNGNLFIGYTTNYSGGDNRVYFISAQINENTGAEIDIGTPLQILSGSPDNIYGCSRYAILNTAKTLIYYSLAYGTPPAAGTTKFVRVDVSDNSYTLINNLIDGVTAGYITCNGLAYKSGSIYMTSDYGLFKFSEIEIGVQKWHRNQFSLDHATEPTALSDGTICYRNEDTVYAITDDGTSYSEAWTTALPTSSASNTSAIIITQDDRLFTAGDNNSGANIIVMDTDGTVIQTVTVGNSTTRTVNYTPVIGSNFEGDAPYFYVPFYDTAPQGIIYVLYDSGGSSSTSSSTDESESTLSTQSAESESTQSETTSQSEVATTTTTTLSPLDIVETDYYELATTQYINAGTTSASNDSGTKGTVFAKSPTFGTLAPGQTSSTIVISLSVPKVKAIKNIKLGLINTGGITFTSTSFGYATSSELRTNIDPDSYFKLTNPSGDKDSAYNIAIPNKDDHSSVYVYLNTKLASNKAIGTGLVKYQWFFEYSS